MRRFAILILIFAMTVLCSCKYFGNNKLFGRKARIAAELQAKQDSIRIADSLKMVQEHLLALENARLDSVRMAEEQFASENKYNIVVGSFLTHEYALDLAEEYKQNGFDTKIIRKEGSNFELVVAESFKNFTNAASRLKQYQDTVAIDSWLYILNR